MLQIFMHVMSPKSTEFLHRTPYFKTQVQKAERVKLWKSRKKITKSSKVVNPITAFKWQGMLSPSLYFSLSPISPLSLIRGSCSPCRVHRGEHCSRAGRWVRSSLCRLSYKRKPNKEGCALGGFQHMKMNCINKHLMCLNCISRQKKDLITLTNKMLKFQTQTYTFKLKLRSSRGFFSLQIISFCPIKMCHDNMVC